MKIFSRILLGIVVLFVLIQLYRPARENPAVDQSKTIEQSTTNVPPNVQTVLSRACSDCHSSKTVWPWYSHIEPVMWMLTDHVNEGRRELNLSEWGGYSARRRRKKLEEICEQVNKGEMPLSSYLWLHHDAKLSSADKSLLCDWANAEKAKIPANASAVPAR